MGVVSVLAVACGGGGDSASSTIPVPSVAGPTTVPGVTAAPAPSLPCETQVFVDLMRSQGGQFELTPAALGALTPIGAPDCSRGYASLSFNGPPEDPGPFGALFAVKPDQTEWDLFAVDCMTSEASGRRQVC